eukprot:UN10773
MIKCLTYFPPFATDLTSCSRARSELENKSSEVEAFSAFSF